jgi:ketosteroid isomerase-like protein
MKKTIASLGLGFLLSTVAAVVIFVTAEAANSESGDVVAAERACAKAFVDADVAALARWIADDYVEMIAEPASPGAAANWRTRSKKEWLDSVRSRQEKYLSVEVRNEKVFLHSDDVATVLAEYSQTVTRDGKDYNETGSEIDTWKKRNGHWQVISSVFP